MIVGLTGGIGSGKSIVAQLFEILNCAVFNSDKVAARLYFNENVRSRVITLLGKEAYTSDRTLNKQFISQKIFVDDALRSALNAIIHPEVGNEFAHFISKNKNKIILKETALLFEAGIDKEVDRIIVVTAPENLRIERVMLRDSLSKEEVLKKIRSQMSEQDKISRADFVVHNDEKEFLITQVLAIYQNLVNV